jgi:hypothetical protein
MEDRLFNLYTLYTFLAGCAELANDKKCVDETYEKLIHEMCITHTKMDDLIHLINSINETRNACYLAEDQELFMSKLKHVAVNSSLILSNAPPDFVPKLSRYLNSWAVSKLLNNSVSQPKVKQLK